jgi:hypothetical protein
MPREFRSALIFLNSIFLDYLGLLNLVINLVRYEFMEEIKLMHKKINFYINTHTTIILKEKLAKFGQIWSKSN